MAAAGSTAVSPYGQYCALSSIERLPRDAARALAAVRRAAAENGGVLDQKAAESIRDSLARKVACTALRHRAYVEALPDAVSSESPWVQVAPDLWVLQDGSGFSRHPPNENPIIFQDFGLPRLHQLAKEKSPSFALGELHQRWFAAFFDLYLLREGYAARGEHRSQHQTLTLPENRRFRATLEDRSENHQWAQQDLLLHTQLEYITPEDLLRGVDRAGPRARRIFEAVAPRAKLGAAAADPPGVALHHLRYLEQVGLTALGASSFGDQQAALGDLPVMRATADFLRSRGLLDFSDLDIFVRSHALPSLAEMLEIVEAAGGHRISGRSKGVSSSPMTVADLRRSAKAFHPGWGDCELAIPPLGADLERAFLLAERRGRPFLILGDGRDSARAAVELAERHPNARIGYVEYTQSGVNLLDLLAEIPLFAEIFADTDLKKVAESETLGEWLADRLASVPEIARRGPLAAQRIAVIGYGDSVGPGVIGGLLGAGATDLIALDRKSTRVDGARRRGIDAEQWESGPIPPAQIYITCTGGTAVLDEAALASMPDGAVVVNYGSKEEIDEALLKRATSSGGGGGIAEHDTLAVSLPGKTIHVLKRGQPFFDGRIDKDRMLTDLYKAGLLCAMALCAERLRDPEGARGRRSLPHDLQLQILRFIEASYPGPEHAERIARLRARLEEGI